MKVGYARVSTDDQDLSLQIEALEAAGCERIFQEKISGTKKDRPELNKLFEHVRPGDVVMVWKLDRLGRSTINLIETVTQWYEAGIYFKSLTDGMSFDNTATGKLFFHIFAAIAEHERNVISERTRAGLAVAKRQGRTGGRPKGLSRESKEKAKVAAKLYLQGDLSVTEICKHLKIARTTLYKWLRHEGIDYNERSSQNSLKPAKKSNNKRNA